MEALYYLYMTLLFLCFSIGIYRYQHADRASRLIVIYTGIAFVTECAAAFSALRYQNNLIIYNFFSVFELGLLSVYFNHAISFFRKHRIGLAVAVLSVVSGCVAFLFSGPPDSLNVSYSLFEMLIITVMVLFYFSQLLSDRRADFLRNFHFWFSGMLLIFWYGSFSVWILYGCYLPDLGPGDLILLDAIHLFFNVFAVSVLYLLFLFYPRLKPCYVL